MADQARTINEQIAIILAEKITPTRFKTVNLDFNKAETIIIIIVLTIAMNIEKIKSM